MNPLLKSVLYALHPLLMPLFGVMIYFSIAPRFVPNAFMLSNSLGLLLVTVVTPILLLFFLKSIKVIPDIKLQKMEERRIPLILQAGCYMLALKTLVNLYNFPELYYFFAGILFSTLLSLALLILKVKANLHMAGIMLITTFTTLTSIHFGINQILLISGLLCITGLMGSACMVHLHSTGKELLAGMFVAIIPQLILFQLWV